MAWHDTWNAMRGSDDRRHWLTRSDLMSLLRKQGYSLTTFTVTQALRARQVDRPMQVHGHFRFTEHHLNQMRSYLDYLKARKAANVARRA
jgi:hypothetical protein